MKNMFASNWYYVGIALIAVGVLYLVAPQGQHKPAGIALPLTEKSFSPSDKAITVYNRYSAPSDHEKLAKINIEFHIPRSNKNKQTLMDNAKKHAQQAGGNGLIVDEISYDAGFMAYHFRGTAIKSS